MHADQVADWIRAHSGAVLASEELTIAFDAYLRTMPWAGAGIDWRGIPHMSLSLDSASSAQILTWARRTGAGLHDYLLLIDSAAGPGAVCRLEDGVRDFDTLSGRPELYMCGVDLAEEQHRPSFGHFIELRSFATLTAPLPNVEHP